MPGRPVGTVFFDDCGVPDAGGDVLDVISHTCPGYPFGRRCTTHGDMRVREVVDLAAITTSRRYQLPGIVPVYELNCAGHALDHVHCGDSIVFVARAIIKLTWYLVGTVLQMAA